MTISMSSVSLPIYSAMLGNLSHILSKAEAFAEAKKVDQTVLLQARLAPDMLPLVRQVQTACEIAIYGVARIAGLEPSKFDDTETTFAQLKSRIQTTLDYLAAVAAQRLDGTEDKELVIPVRGTTRTMKAEAYLKHWSLPNLFFHVTTTYAILRHNGVELGKADYLLGDKAVAA